MTLKTAKDNSDTPMPYSELPMNKLVAQAPSRENEVAEMAYFKAESRGFAPGYEMDDWLEAEQAISQM